jgi:2-polyprenyl-6-methoxyphenol hydroxylase-like FAD-dependent oxidoreductase
MFEGTQHVSVWPVGAPEAGGCRQVSVSINVPLASAAAFVTEGEWKRTAVRICPWLRELFRNDASREPRPIVYRYGDVVLRRHAIGRLAFIGDAAHSMSPQLGQGVRLALQDAQCLAEALGDSADLVAALGSFDAGQRRRLAPSQRACRFLTPWFQSHYTLLAATRDRLAGPIGRSPYVRARMHALLTGGNVVGGQSAPS